MTAQHGQARESKSLDRAEVIVRDEARHPHATWALEDAAINWKAWDPQNDGGVV